MKEIKKIVLYKSIENGKEITKSCVFYNDGTTISGNYDYGIKAIKEVAEAKNITSKTQLKELMNKDIIYTMTEEEFKKNYIPFLLKDNKEEVKAKPVKKEPIERIPGLVEVYAKDERRNIEEDFDEEEIVYEEEYDPYAGVFVTSDDKSTSYEKSTKVNNRGCLGLVAGVLVIGLGITGITLLASRCSRKSKVGTMAPVIISTESQKDNHTTTTNTTTATETTETTKVTETTKQVVYNNDLYNDYNYSQLLNVTKNATQKEAMISLGSTLVGFNSTFAKNYMESGHDIKAALSFDEMVALQQAYNKYSKDDIKAYFNGAEVDAVKMSDNYKNASLQLMGAYIIESKEHPVDISGLINDQAGIEYYKAYHNLFLAAKEAKGEEQKKLVKEFFANVRKDFPVTSKVRTEGIAHSESREQVEDYQLAVTPMIAAAEMIFQNLGKDYTLNKTEINFLNDIGLCNHADDKFERIETITLSANEDKTNPTYDQYRTAIIAMLVNNDNYVIDDDHRELSNLRRFQEIVNGDALWKYRNAEEKAKSNGTNNSNNNNKTTKRTYTKTTTSKKTVTETKNGGPIPSDKKAEIDKKTEEENKKAKEEAEKKAKEEAARQQAEEDKKKKAIEESIAKANEEKKKKAEEEAKKDNSVKNVSPSSGPKQTLPNPNEYGENFDERVKVKK